MTEKNQHCACGHVHDHASSISLKKKWFLSVSFIFLSLVALKPFLFTQIFNRACAYLAYPLYDDAIRQYKKCVFLNKNSDDALDWLGYAYKGKGDTRKAIEAYTDAIKINPYNKKAHFSLGMIYVMNKKFNEAARHFSCIVAMGKENEATLDLISYHRSSCEMLITCFEKLGNAAELKHAIDVTLKFYPDNAKAKDRFLKIKGI